MNKWLIRIQLLVLTLLAACTAAPESSTSGELALAVNQPTFLFFFTDN